MKKYVADAPKSKLDQAYGTLDSYMKIMFISAMNNNAEQVATTADYIQNWTDNLDDCTKRVIVPEIGSIASEMTRLGGTMMFFNAAVSAITYFAHDEALQNDKPVERCNGDDEPYNKAHKTGHLALVALRDLGVSMKLQNKNQQENVVKNAIIECLMAS